MSRQPKTIMRRDGAPSAPRPPPSYASDHSTDPAAPAESVGGTVSPSQQPSDSPSSPGSEGSACDLCQGYLGDLTVNEHYDRHHAELLQWCQRLKDSKAQLSAAPVSPAAIAELGRNVAAAARRADGGPNAFQTVLCAVEQLDAITRSRFSRCRTFLFGSCIATSVWDGEGDIDMTVVDPQQWETGHWPPEDEPGVIMQLTRQLRDAGFAYDDLEPVRFTRVPIVKHKTTRKEDRWRLGDVKCRTIAVQFEDGRLDERDVGQAFKGDGSRRLSWSGRRLFVECPTTTDALLCYLERTLLPRSVPRIRYKCFEDSHYKPELFYTDFDLSCRAFGVRNSYFLRRYLEQHPLARAGSLWVKRWSKGSGVNNSKRGYLTSYAVNILWIYYLLQAGLLEWFSPEAVSALPSDDDIEKLRYSRVLPNAKPEGEETLERQLGDLVLGFFRFYAFTFDWETQVVSLKHKHTVTKESINWRPGDGGNEVHAKLFRDRIWYRLCIEDPYEANLNLGRHLSPIKVDKVLAEFLYGVQCMAQGHVARLHLDRTVDHVTTELRRSVLRLFIGRTEERQDSHVLEDMLSLDGHDALLAAFETEHKRSKLFALADLSSRPIEEGAPGTYLRARTAIAASALHQLARIEEELRVNPTVGHLVDGHTADLNLDELFYYDSPSNRFFLRDSDRRVFEHHLSSLRSLLEEQSAVTVMEAHDALRRRYRRYDAATLDAVLSTHHTQISRKGDVLQLARRERIGRCAECNRRNVVVWPDPKLPSSTEEFCQDCWDDYLGQSDTKK